MRLGEFSGVEYMHLLFAAQIVAAEITSSHYAPFTGDIETGSDTW